MTGPSMEAELAAWGKVILLETRGRRSGRPRSAAVGFIAAPHGALLVAATATTTHWAANLLADPGCVVELDGIRGRFIAIELDAPARAAAIAQLILKYGTPAEQLGAGPAFRLEPRP